MSDDPQDLEAVQQKLDEIRRRKRGGIRWNMSRHTAERAIEAIELGNLPGPQPPRGKSRRRKRTKRLL